MSRATRTSCNLVFLLYYAAMVMTYPLGISLGQKYLTSAYYTQSNELVPVVRIVASEEWQSYFSETLKDPKHQSSRDDTQVRLLFKSTLHQIGAASEKALNGTITTNSIVAPEHFSESHSIQLMVETAVEEGFTEVFHQVITALNGARLAYSLDTCAALGVKPSPECDDFDLKVGYNYVLVVNYNPGCFSLAVVDIRHYLCVPHNIAHYEQYGENSGSILKKPRIDYFSQDLRAYLATFAETWKNTRDPNPLEYLRAIVLSGEASTTGMAEMRQALTAGLPEFQNKLLMFLDPQFVGAFGAAQRARHIIQDPSFMDPWAAGYKPGVVSEEVPHREL